MKGCEPYYTLTCIGILGKIRTGAPVWQYKEISKIRSWKYAKHSLKSRSANCINITKNNLEFVVCECRNRTCSGLVDMNVIKREDRHSLKCKGLTVEWQFLWNIITVVIPVWIRANRIISKSSRNYLNNITGNQGTKETTEHSHTCTVDILRKVIKQKYETIIHGNAHHTLYHRITSKLYTLETRCFSDI